MAHLPSLLSPGQIGPMSVRNRIAVTAMGASLAEEDGQCGPRIIAYHEEQAKGGVGLVITGVAGVAWPVGANQTHQIAISDDRFLPGLTSLTEAVHRHGAKIAAQIHHGGLVAMQDMLAGRPIWAPSYPPAPSGDFTESFLLEELAEAPFSQVQAIAIKVMTVDDIHLVVEQFADAADRARRAGFDGVEIHGGHGYLLSSFVSPKTNQRTDAYGGPLENRARFLLEVIRAVKARVGGAMAVWCKLDSREVGVEKGIEIEDSVRLARWVEEAGAEAITVTAYHDAGQPKLHSGSHTPHDPGVNLPYAARIKMAVGIPIIASGRIEPKAGDQAIAKGMIDFLSMGRKLLADPHLPAKLAQGRERDVRPCIYCYTCISAIYLGQPMRCAVNPELGSEYLTTPERGGGKRIVVIGGGPGGMEAARRLDAGGHKVILVEADDRLGGTLRFASLAYPANERLLDWLRRQIENSDVEVRLRTRATAELMHEFAPDAIVVATGAVRGLAPIPGNHLPHVLSGDDLRGLMLGKDGAGLKRKIGLATRIATRVGAATGLTANLDFVREATRTWMPFGQRIVIIGGELVGLELAEFLVERGRDVTVVDDIARFGAGLTVVRRMRLLAELAEHGVCLRPRARDLSIEETLVRFTDRTGGERSVEADHVIIAKGATGDLGLAAELRAEGHEVHEIGDCSGVGYIEKAMRGAAVAVAAISTGA